MGGPWFAASGDFSQGIYTSCDRCAETDKGAPQKAKWPTYKAWCNHDGSYSTKKYPNWDWNAEFLEPVADDLRSPWHEFDDACIKAQEKCLQALGGLLDGIRKELSGEYMEE